MNLNSIRTIHYECLRPNRTIEAIEILREKQKTILFMYNHEGIYYHLFPSMISMFEYFNSNAQAYICFEKECELDAYLENPLSPIFEECLY